MVSGRDASNVLSRLCTARGMDNGSISACVYTLMLNSKGGTEADLIVTRLKDDSYYLTVGSGVPDYVARHIRKGVEPGEDVAVKDVSADFGILSVQGPNSKKIVEEMFVEAMDPGNYKTECWIEPRSKRV